MTKRLPLLAAMAGLALALTTASAAAQTPTNSLAADAFGFKAIVSPFQQDPVRVGPAPKVNVFMPPQSDGASASVAEVGPAPGDGALIQHVRALKVTGDGDVAKGTATATAETGAVSLFGGQISADALKAVSTSACPGPGDAVAASAGSQVVGLSIGGNQIPITPEPNQVTIRLAQEDGTGLADVRVYEVIPDADGQGWTTRMLHIFTLDPLTQAVNGEIIVAAAHAAVTCGATPSVSGGADNEVVISQEVEPPDPDRGEDVVYDITVRNRGTRNCTVYEVTDRLPPVVTFKQAAGFLADVEPEVNGREVLFDNPAGWPLAPGQSLNGQVTATVNADAAPGTYMNVVIVRTTCGVFTGVGAPITIGPLAQAGPLDDLDDVGDVEPSAAPLPTTGAGLGLGAMTLLGMSAGVRLLLRRRD